MHILEMEVKVNSSDNVNNDFIQIGSWVQIIDIEKISYLVLYKKFKYLRAQYD